MPRQPTVAEPLTAQRLARELRAPTRNAEIADGAVPGLVLRLRRSGAATWTVRHGLGGFDRRVTLGKAGPGGLGLDEARRRAKAVLGDLARGVDPTAEKRARLAAAAEAERRRRERVTVGDLWRRYEAEVIAARNRPSTARQKARMWETKIGPAIGALPVAEVDAEACRAIVRGPLRLDPRTKRVVGGVAEAGNLYRLLKHLFRTAIRWKLRAPGTDPTAELDAPKVARRERLLSDAELAAIAAALDAAEAAGRPWPIVAALRFALLTGWRAGEILTLRREWLRAERAEAHLPDTKTGHSVRPLGAAALALLARLPRIVGSPYVFPAPRDASKPLPYATLAGAFADVTKAAGLRGVSLHTLRHRIVTDLANEAPNVRVGMAVSGHKSVAAFMGYVHAERARAGAVADAVSGRIAALAPPPEAGNVVRLPVPARAKAKPQRAARKRRQRPV